MATFKKDFELNEDQLKAKEAIEDFLGDSSRKVFVLSGPGGTGKSFTIGRALTNRIQERALYVAPTHKAKAILSASTGQQAVTLASSLCIKLDERTGKFKPDEWSRRKGIPIEKSKYIIIDECSMISDDLVDEILEHTQLNSKIICLGDPCQLPPVGQSTDSKIFQYGGYNLTKKVRQKDDSDAVPILDMLRLNIESEDSIERAVTKRNDGNDLFFFDNMNEFIDRFCFYHKLGDSTKIVTYNNHMHDDPLSVKTINRIVRSRLGYTGDFQVGESIMFYDRFKNEKDESFEKASDYEILEILSGEYDMDISVPDKKMPVSILDIKIKVIDIKIQNLVTGEKLRTWVPTRDWHQKINKGLKVLFQRKDFYKGYKLREMIPNIEYGYSCTSHLSQGSTYDHAFVLEDNILGGKFRKNKEKNQALYVAASRYSKTLSIYSTWKNQQKSIGFLSF